MAAANRVFRSLKRKATDAELSVSHKPIKAHRLDAGEEVALGPGSDRAGPQLLSAQSGADTTNEVEPDSPADRAIPAGQKASFPLPEPKRASTQDASQSSGGVVQKAELFGHAGEGALKETSESGQQADHARRSRTPLEDAIELVERDRACLRARAHCSRLDDGLNEGENIMQRLERDIEWLEDENRGANAYAIDQARQQIEYIHRGLERLEDQWDAAGRNRVHAEARRQEVISRLISPFLQEAASVAVRERQRDFSAEVFEAIARCLELQGSLSGQRTQRDTAVDREHGIRLRIRMIEYQLALDEQLGQADRGAFALAERTIAYHEGVLAVLVKQIDLQAQVINTLLWDREGADGQLCRAVERMVVRAVLVAAGGDDDVHDGPSSGGTRSATAGECSASRRAGGSRGRSATDRHSSSSAEPTLEQRLRSNKTCARQNLATAWQRFEDLRARYPADLFLFDMIQNPEASRAEFDLAYLASRRDWTGRIIAAEKELESGKQAMKAAGIPPSDAAASGFPDLTEDGYNESLEDAAVAQVDRARLEAWLGGVEDSSQAFEIQEPADWPDDMEDGQLDVAEREALVGFGDSVSCVANGKAGDRIRDWSGRDRREK
ncbi:hypothetical protein LTR85_002591 [Meristemomyces frigidus]|nr:hypothetical protein LTR85_002591 [Meristemomyces frigidus]